MIKSKEIKYKVGSNLLNSIGKRVNKKLVVFESDDWGAIRMPSKKVYEYLLKKGTINDKCVYSKYDSIATNDDWEILLTTLSKFKDYWGGNPTFTSNFIMTNPNFPKIKSDKYYRYHNEPFFETVSEYPNSDKYQDLLFSGIREGLIIPQLHGREHVNINRWLKELQANNIDYLNAFKNKTYNVKQHKTWFNGKSIFASLDFDDYNELNCHSTIITDAYCLFKEVFGFESLSFIAPNYIWNHEHEKTLITCGIEIIQGTKLQNIPNINSDKYNKKIRVQGSHKKGLFHVVRNCFFEPSSSTSGNTVDSCLSDINRAFRWHQPAIISTHRLNYIGRNDKSNRDRNIGSLELLLKSILDLWPDVQFTSTNSLKHHFYAN